MSNLDRVGIWIRKPAPDNRADLIVRVRKSPTADRDIAVIRTRVDEIVSGQIHWFQFRPIGDDEDPTYFVDVYSPESTEDHAPEVRVETEPVAWAIGQMHIDGVEQEGFLHVALHTERSLWTRIGYVLARFEIDKPWFYNRYFYAGIFLLYGAMIVGFLIFTYKLLQRAGEVTRGNNSLPVTFILFVTGLFLVRGVLYSSLFPAWQAPDEPAHFAMIAYIAEHRALPEWDATIDQRILASLDRADHALIYRGGRPKPDWQTWVVDPREATASGNRVFMTAANLPFLYHFVMSYPYMIIEDLDPITQLCILRSLAVVISCVSIIFAYKVSRLLTPDQPVLHILIPSVLCFSSMFTYMGSVVSYDVLTNVLCTLFIALLVFAMIRGLSWKNTVIGGGILGGALLTKAAALIILPATIAWLALACRDASGRTGLVTRWCVMMAIAFCIGGWWYAENYISTGQLVYQPNPSWTEGEFNADLGLTTTEELGWKERREPIPAYSAMWQTVSRAYLGTIGGFGWGNVPLPTGFYLIFTVIFICACLGGMLVCRDVLKGFPALSDRQNRALLWLATAAALYCVFLFIEMGRLTIGRYLFPIILPVVVWLSIGLLRLAPPAHKNFGGWIIIVVFILFDTLILFEIIIPRYYLIPPPSRIFEYF